MKAREDCDWTKETKRRQVNITYFSWEGSTESENEEKEKVGRGKRELRNSEMKTTMLLFVTSLGEDRANWPYSRLPQRARVHLEPALFPLMTDAWNGKRVSRRGKRVMYTNQEKRLVQKIVSSS